MADKETKYLKTLKPKDALSVMLTEANNLRYPLYDLVPSLPRKVAGTRTQVDLKARDQVAKDDFYPYTGEVKDFTFNRVDLKQEYGGKMEGFRLTLPSSTKELTDELTRRFGTEFEIDDVVFETIHSRNSVPYTLKAKVESLRFVGQVDFVLSDVRDLSEIARDSLGNPAYTKFMAELPLASPYANATGWMDRLNSLWPGSDAQTQAEFLNLFKGTIAPLNVHAKLASPSPWVISPTPAPFNLYNAQLVTQDAGVVNYPALANSKLNHVAEFALSKEYCTNISEARALLWYADEESKDTQIRMTPRLRQSGTLNTTDATAYAEWLGTLKVSDVITASPHASMTMEPGVNWTVGTTKSPTNLYGAVVQYNGLRRGQDSTSIYNDLTHVLVVSMDERYNSLWRGNLSFFYSEAAVQPKGFTVEVFRGSKVGETITLIPQETPEWMKHGNPVVGDTTRPGGKVTLDGSSYLQAAVHEAFNFGTDDFTFEFTVEFANLPATIAVGLVGTANVQLGDENTGLVYMYGAEPSLPPGYAGTFLFGTTDVGLSALTSERVLTAGRTKVSITRRNGSMFHLFYNEQQSGQGNGFVDPGAVVNLAKADGVTIGAITSSSDIAKFTGEISDMRIIKGLALYEPAPRIYFADANGSETDDGRTLYENGTLDLTVIVDPPLSQARTVQLSFTGDAQVGREYNLAQGGTSITIPAGAGEFTFTLRGIETSAFNGARSFNVGLTSGEGYMAAEPKTAYCTLRDAVYIAPVWPRQTAGRVRSGRDVDIVVDPGLFYVPQWQRMLGQHVDGLYMYRHAHDVTRIANGGFIRGHAPWAAYSPKHDAVLIMYAGGARMVYGPKTNYRVVESTSGLASRVSPTSPMWIAEWDVFVAFDLYTSTVIKSADGLTWSAMPAMAGVTNTQSNWMYGMVWDKVNQRLLVLGNLGLTSNTGSQVGGRILAYTAVNQSAAPTVVATVPYYLLENCFFYSEVWGKYVMTVWANLPNLGLTPGFYLSDDLSNWTRMEMPPGNTSLMTHFNDVPQRQTVYARQNDGKLWAWKEGEWREATSANNSTDPGAHLAYHQVEDQLWSNLSNGDEQAVDIYVDKATALIGWDGTWETLRNSGPGVGETRYVPHLDKLLVANTSAEVTADGLTWASAGISGAVISAGFIPDFATLIVQSTGTLVDTGSGYGAQIQQTNRPTGNVFHGDDIVLGFTAGAARWQYKADLTNPNAAWSNMTRAEFGEQSRAAFADREGIWTTIAFPSRQLWYANANPSLASASWTRIGTTTNKWNDLCYANGMNMMFFAASDGIYSTPARYEPVKQISTTVAVQGVIYVPEANSVVAWTTDSVYVYNGQEWKTYAAPFTGTYVIAWMPNVKRLVAFSKNRSRRTAAFLDV